MGVLSSLILADFRWKKRWVVQKQFRQYSVMSYPIHVDNSKSIQNSTTSPQSTHNATVQTARCSSSGRNKTIYTCEDRYLAVLKSSWGLFADGNLVLFQLSLLHRYWVVMVRHCPDLFFAQPRSACSLSCDSSLQQDLGGVKKLFDYSPFNHFIQIFAEFVILYSHYHAVL